MKDKKLKIVFVCGWYSSPFGYIHNNLPRALARLGHEIHIVTSNSQQYSNTPDYESTYAKFLGPKYTALGVSNEHGVTIHRLPISNFKTEIYPKHLYSKLKELKPDIVHIFDIGAMVTFKLSLYKMRLGYRFINSNHILQSVFPMAQNWETKGFLSKLKWNLFHKIPGRFIYSNTDLTIYPTIDAKELAVNFFGFRDKKNIIKSLAVDTELFKPLDKTKQNALKIETGFDVNDFICIYTGRFSEDKNPLQLAIAIQNLRMSYPKIKGLFVGEGVQMEQIKSIDGCVVRPFANQTELVEYYNVGSVGVWPKQESTSMLDCLACGTPIIVNNTVKAVERVDGNGEMFELNSVSSLANLIQKFYLNKKLVDLYGQTGMKKVVSMYSWNKYAEDYIQLISAR